MDDENAIPLTPAESLIADWNETQGAEAYTALVRYIGALEAVSEAVDAMLAEDIFSDEYWVRQDAVLAALDAADDLRDGVT